MSKNSVYSLNNCNAKQANGWIECYKYPSYVRENSTQYTSIVNQQKSSFDKHKFFFWPYFAYICISVWGCLEHLNIGIFVLLRASV